MATVRSWLLVVGLLAIVAAGMYRVVFLVEQTTRQALAPLQPLGTQVARVLNPTPTIRPKPETIVHRIQPLGRLETVQYTLEKVITAEVGPPGLWGRLFGDRLLFVAHGRVIAGVDLSRLTPEDVWYQGDVLMLRLPPAEVFEVVLDNQRSYVYDRQTGLLTKGNMALETEARRAAEDLLLQAALEDGILRQARVNAEAVLTRFLNLLGISQVVFVAPESTPTPTPTATAPPESP